LQSLGSFSRPLKKPSSYLWLRNINYTVNRWDDRRLNCYFDVAFVHGGLMWWLWTVMLVLLCTLNRILRYCMPVTQ
jgi:hypothetical protein